MEKFLTHTGVVAPLKRSNVDTDQIIPAVYLKRVTKTGFEDALFANWRQDPEFVLNQPAFAGASVLVAGPDFGTGSSREHAVWALRDFGFAVVLSPKFADIFRGNSGKQGLVTGIISEEDLERIWAAIDADPGVQMTVDLEARSAQTACSRLDPVPKSAPATRMPAPWNAGWLRTNSGSWRQAANSASSNPVLVTRLR